MKYLLTVFALFATFVANAVEVEKLDIKTSRVTYGKYAI